VKGTLNHRTLINKHTDETKPSQTKLPRNDLIIKGDGFVKENMKKA
jgi:hypothetical protein